MSDSDEKNPLDNELEDLLDDSGENPLDNELEDLLDEPVEGFEDVPNVEDIPDVEPLPPYDPVSSPVDPEPAPDPIFDPNAGYQPVSSTPANSTMAVVSVVAGVLGLTFVPFLGSIVAIITGYLARKEIRESGGTLGGENFVSAGLILGYVGVGFTFLLACCVIVAAFSIFGIASSQTSALPLLSLLLV